MRIHAYSCLSMVHVPPLAACYVVAATDKCHSLYHEIARRWACSDRGWAWCETFQLLGQENRGAHICFSGTCMM